MKPVGLKPFHSYVCSLQLSKTLPLIRSCYRLLLTGSPIQNNLQEMWALFDYACEGKLFGPAANFAREVTAQLQFLR
jgi:SNF2 family DNA or RNA helicase